MSISVKTDVVIHPAKDDVVAFVMGADKPFDMTIRYEFVKKRLAALSCESRAQGGGRECYKIAGPILGRMVNRNIALYV